MPGNEPVGRGPKLPYKRVAGVEPCREGWLVVGGRIYGSTLTPQQPEITASFVNVLDARPAYSVIALHCPVGLLDTAVSGGRSCDRDARRLLGFPRASSIVSPPARSALAALDNRRTRFGVGSASKERLRYVAEVDHEMQPYWQRTVHEVNPELAFFTLNGDVPLSTPKRTPRGQDERRRLLEGKIHRLDQILEALPSGIRQWQLLDGLADLLTCRRIAVRASVRLPESPEWDTQGFRMELSR